MTEPRRDAPSPGLGQTTAYLLSRARQGDEAARDQLFARFLSVLRRWAHGRLPAYARDLADTDDLVQSALRRTLNHMEAFEPREEGAFLAYLRRATWNRMVDEIRRARRMPERVELNEGIAAPDPSVIDRVVQRDEIERYEGALARLPEREQAAVMLRLEFGFSYPEIAEALGHPSPNAARMSVVRSVRRLAEEMR